ncbi:hypothetical protein U1Q18_009493 [Sarracenia purpurea var. burkii]
MVTYLTMTILSWLQFVDQCGTIHDIIKAWNRHRKLFPHLIRTTSSNKLPTIGNQLSKMVMEGRKKSPLPLSDKPSGGHNPDHLIQLQMPEQRLLLPEDKDNSAQERLQHLSPKIAERASEDVFRVNKSAHCSVHQSGDDASRQMESTAYSICQSREAVYEPVKSKDSLLPIEPINDLVQEVADDHAILDASQEYSESINVQQEKDQDHQPEQHLNPLPLDDLLLNSQEKEYEDSTPISCGEHQSPTSNRIPENSQNANKNPSMLSPGSTRSDDSAHDQNESVSPLSDQNPLQDQQNQQRQVSPRQQSPPAEMGASTLNNQGYSNHPLPGKNPQVQQGIQGAAQGNPNATHSWPTQNLQQQSFVSVHQSQPDSLPASQSQAQMPQFSTQSGGQFGSAAPYNQAYNQMMENYIRQQQQMIVQHYEQQQQFMQQLQHQVQQTYQQQQQQQHLPQPYQQNEVYAQQQRELAQLFYQQLPQLREQQAQLMRQQLQHAPQQQDQLYHPYMQMQEQQQQHGYQQQNPMQQHPLQPVTSTQTPAWNGSYYQQPSSLQNFGSSHSGVESSQQSVTSQVNETVL